MPKVTFFNLSEEKQQTLLCAAKKEFSRVPLFNASISNIIKDAGIPRGSFYQYFDDKEDTFFFLLNEFAKDKKKDFHRILTELQGDIFETTIEFFEVIMKEQEDFHFLKNALLNMTYQIESTFERMISDDELNEKNFDYLHQLIDKSKLNIDDDKELSHILQIITAVTFRNMIHAFATNMAYDEAMKDFLIDMNLLKKGLQKNK